MSADNWATCPRCVRRHKAAIEAAKVRVAEAYGKVPVDDWKALEAEVEKMRNEYPDPTFREDYEIYGAEQGVVIVRYTGNCSLCGLKLNINEQHTIEDIDA